MLKKLSKVYKRKGAKGLLPHKLPDDVFNYMLSNVDKFLDGELEEENKGFSCIFFCVLMILNHQNGDTGEFQLPPEELFEAMQNYCIALTMEEVNKKTDMKTTPPTVFNILDSKRQVEISSDAVEDDEPDDIATSIVNQFGPRYVNAVMKKEARLKSTKSES